MEDLQKILITIRMKKLLSINKMATDIGISRITLMDFLDYKVKPTFLTLAKITKYIEGNEDILKNKEIK